ncbi:hypothetical protein Tco_0593644 [Tanacetum coccineum]
MEKKVNSRYVMENVLKGYGRSLVGNVGNIKFMCMGGLKMNDEEDEDRDQIKGLIWVNNHIANIRRKDWASVIMGLFRKEMFGVCVEEMKSLVGLFYGLGGFFGSLGFLLSKPLGFRSVAVVFSLNIVGRVLEQSQVLCLGFTFVAGSRFCVTHDCGNGIVQFVLYDLTKPQVPSCPEQLDHVGDEVRDLHNGFTLALLDNLFSKGLCTVKFIPPKCRLGFSHALKGALDKVICKPGDISCWVSLLVLPLCLLKIIRPRSNLECTSAIKRQHQEESIVNVIRSWGMPGGSLQLLRETLAESSPTLSDVDDEDIDFGEPNIKQCKRKISDGHYTAAVRVLSSSSVAPYSDATLEDLKTKHPFKPAPSLPHIPFDHHHLIASPIVVLDRIKSFPHGTSYGRDGLRAQHLIDCLSGSTVVVSDELVSSITQVVNLFLDRSCPKMLGEYISSASLTPLVKLSGGIRPIAVGTVWRRLVSKVSALMIGHSLDGYLDDLQFDVGVSGGSEAILYVVNRLIEGRGNDVGLSMFLVDFKNVFNLVDQEIMLREVLLRCPAISRWVELCYSNPTRFHYGEHTLWLCQGAWYLDDGIIVGDTLVVGKVLELIMEDGPRYGLHLNVDITEVFWPVEDPRSRLKGLVMKRVAKTIALMDTVAKINDLKCELLLLRSCTSISKLYFSMRTCPPRVFDFVQRSFDVALRSSLERISAVLQTKLLRHTCIVASGPNFDDALRVFNMSMETDFLSNPNEITAPKLMKKMADIYFTRVTENAESTFSLSPRQMGLLKSQRENHTSDCLRTLPISGLGQTMNGKTSRRVLCYRLGIFLFSVSKPCSRVFVGDIYGDRALVLLVLNIAIMLCVILLSTCVIVMGFELVRKLISG